MLRVEVSPSVLFSITDAVVRRPLNSSERMIGTLMGCDHEGTIEIQNSFPVSHNESGDTLYLDSVFHREMVGLSMQVNKKEFVVGWYSTGPIFPINLAAQVNDFYFGSTRQPIYLNIDTTLSSGRLGIKAYVLGLDKTVEEKRIIMTEVPCQIRASPEEKLAVHTLVRTLHPKEPKCDRVLTELESFQLALQKVVKMLDICTEYVDNVLEGRIQGDPKIGHLLLRTLNSVPTIDVAAFERNFEQRMQDLLMATYLANITKSQITLAEKLQTSF